MDNKSEEEKTKEKDNPNGETGKPQPKPKNRMIPCKQCGKKWKNLIQLTNHMKTSHTKTDLEETGNAITVNSPFLQVQHFFCHCALCGEGYNDYSQLSKHENEQHNFKCNECDESFMIETELQMHVRNKHGDHSVQCVLLNHK